jgi:hypothetical protein
MTAYAGLIEVALTLGGVTLFVWWQMRSLNRDVAATKARERQDAEAQSAAAETKAN